MKLMWKNIVGSLKAETFYIEKDQYFLVRVTNMITNKTLSENFKALHNPMFGMDLIDTNHSLSIAEELALELEKND